MTLETFFEKFDLFADAPDAVPKMRELVLELAVRGQLSERLPEDQDDPAWRAFIQEFDNRIYGSDPGPPPPFNVPDEWRWVCLEDVGTTKVRNDVDDATSVSFVPMALISATYGVSVQSEERTWGEIKKGFTHFADNDVVLAKITPCFENAKSAVMRNLINGVGAGTTELHVFRSTTKVILPDYVLLYIKTRGFISRGESRMTGSAGQKRVPREYFATSPFPLPPLAEQKRIVAKVDELMALCDRLEEQQQEREKRHAALARASLTRFAEAPTAGNLQYLVHDSVPIPPADLRKAILTLAVQGKLVPQDPTDEPAEVLLRNIRRKKDAMLAAKQIRQGKVSRPHTAEDAPENIPTSWQWVNVDAFCFKVTDGTHFTPQYSESGVRFVSAKDVVDGKLRFDRCKFITREEHDQLFRRCNPEFHDIVITKSGSIGSVALVEDRGEFSLFESLALLKFDQEQLYAPFLVYSLTHACSSLTSGHIRGVAVKHLHLDMLRGLELALPPLAEQRRIVVKVEQLMTLVDALETQLAAGRVTAAKLLAALVAELTGTKSTGQASKPTASAPARRGRPRKAT